MDEQDLLSEIENLVEKVLESRQKTGFPSSDALDELEDFMTNHVWEAGD